MRIFSDSDIPEADDSTLEVLDDTWLHIELDLDRDTEGPEFAKVTKRLKDENGLPIGTANDNPLLNTRKYEVEYQDGYRASLAANQNAMCMFVQVDDECNMHVLFDCTMDSRTDGKEVKFENSYIKSKNGGHTRRETTNGWEILIKWKDGSFTWETMKDVKESYPVQLAEFSVEARLDQEAAVAWWVPRVLKKRTAIIAKIKTKYWVRTHKYGIKIPRNTAEAKAFDAKNGNMLWWDSITKDMKNVRVAFEEFEGDVKDIPKGYQHVDCHLIVYIKMG